MKLRELIRQKQIHELSHISALTLINASSHFLLLVSSPLSITDCSPVKLLTEAKTSMVIFCTPFNFTGEQTASGKS